MTETTVAPFKNPFRPGAGHTPPFLAGRDEERHVFSKLLEQDVILENFVLTGLRGVGKTVLADEMKPMAQAKGWIVVGSDLSETVSVSEENFATRILADLSVFTAQITVATRQVPKIGFIGEAEHEEIKLNYAVLWSIYENTPGLTSDRLEAVLMTVFNALPEGKKRILFVYDEAQNLSDNAPKDQYPLSVMLDVFQRIQKKGVPFMLMLVGLPTLFPKLVDARTFAERMFRVVFLERLSDDDARAAITKPLDDADCPVRPTPESVQAMCAMSGGYPYFLQFIGRELFDVWIVDPSATIPAEDIYNKLDSDFFSGRWERATDRQRDLLLVIASLETCDAEFTVQEIVVKSASLKDPFKSSNVNQMLSVLIAKGLIFKNRYGKYSLSVPLLDRFIRRQPAYESFLVKLEPA